MSSLIRASSRSCRKVPRLWIGVLLQKQIPPDPKMQQLLTRVVPMPCRMHTAGVSSYSNSSNSNSCSNKTKTRCNPVHLRLSLLVSLASEQATLSNPLTRHLHLRRGYASRSMKPATSNGLMSSSYGKRRKAHALADAILSEEDRCRPRHRAHPLRNLRIAKTQRSLLSLPQHRHPTLPVGEEALSRATLFPL